MKNRSILYFLAVGVFSASPALADKISSPSMGQDENSVSIHELSKGNFSQLKDFDEGAKGSILKGLLSSKSGTDDTASKFIEIGSMHGEKLGTIHHKDFGKHHPVVVVDDTPPTSVPEPRSLTLLLLGMGALGTFLYRRNLL